MKVLRKCDGCTAMPRDNSSRANARHAKAKRAAALSRAELGWPTTPRRPAAGVTSMAVKAEDPAIRAMIDAAMADKPHQ